MSEDIYIDVNYLTESERDIILQVLAKDEELRKQEKRRIRCVNLNFVWTNVWVAFIVRHVSTFWTYPWYCLAVSYPVLVVDKKPLFSFSTLKNELDQIKKNGATPDEIETSRICARCRSPLGWIVNSGALCPKCEARVCKDCRKMTSYSWLCILCAKIRWNI